MFVMRRTSREVYEVVGRRITLPCAEIDIAQCTWDLLLRCASIVASSQVIKNG
jgi:hypothetical protein